MKSRVKNVGIKKIVLLGLPVLILMALVFFLLSDRKPTLRLEQIKTTISPFADERVVVTAKVKYEDSSPFGRIDQYIKGVDAEGPDVQTSYWIQDEKGRKHGVSKFGSWSNSIAQVKRREYYIELDVPVKSIPGSLGTLTLVGKLSTKDGASLLFSAPLR